MASQSYIYIIVGATKCDEARKRLPGRRDRTSKGPGAGGRMSALSGEITQFSQGC